MSVHRLLPAIGSIWLLLALTPAQAQDLLPEPIGERGLFELDRAMDAAFNDDLESICRCRRVSSATRFERTVERLEEFEEALDPARLRELLLAEGVDVPVEPEDDPSRFLKRAISRAISRSENDRLHDRLSDLLRDAEGLETLRANRSTRLDRLIDMERRLDPRRLRESLRAEGLDIPVEPGEWPTAYLRRVIFTAHRLGTYDDLLDHLVDLRKEADELEIGLYLRGRSTDNPWVSFDYWRRTREYRGLRDGYEGLDRPPDLDREVEILRILREAFADCRGEDAVPPPPAERTDIHEGLLIDLPRDRPVDPPTVERLREALRHELRNLCCKLYEDGAFGAWIGNATIGIDDAPPEVRETAYAYRDLLWDLSTIMRERGFHEPVQVEPGFVRKRCDDEVIESMGMGLLIEPEDEPPPAEAEDPFADGPADPSDERARGVAREDDPVPDPPAPSVGARAPDPDDVDDGEARRRRLWPPSPRESSGGGFQSEGLGGGLVIDVDEGGIDVSRFDPGGSDFRTGGGGVGDIPRGPEDAAAGDVGDWNDPFGDGVVDPTEPDPNDPIVDPGDRDRPPEDGGPPRDEPRGGDPPDDDPGGDDTPKDIPADEDLPENVCGPDVTAAYVVALERAYDRLSKLGDEERGAWDGMHFLRRNGANIDMVARAVTLEDAVPEAGVDGRRCPRGICERTVTLAGYCVTSHVANDIMYGFAVEMLGVPWMIALGGAHAWDVLQYGGLDPNTSKAAYTFGSNLARWMGAGRPLSEPAFKRLMERTTIVEGGLFGAETITLVELVRRDEAHVLRCEPCPEDCASDLSKDFSTMSWSLSDGKKSTHDDAEDDSAPEPPDSPDDAGTPGDPGAPGDPGTPDEPEIQDAPPGPACGTAAIRFGLCEEPTGNGARPGEGPSTIDASVEPEVLGGPSGGDGSDAPVEIVIQGRGRASGDGVFDVFILHDEENGGDEAPPSRIVLPPGTVLEPVEDPDPETLERAREIISLVKGGKTTGFWFEIPGRSRPTFRDPDPFTVGFFGLANGGSVEMPAYCLDRERNPPGDGMLYRIAPPDDQESVALWLTSILAASKQLREQGALRPDSDPDAYFHSVRQWAIWVYAEGMDRPTFERAFLDHMRENVEAEGHEWSEETAEAVRGFLPNRWRDVMRVIWTAERL